MKHVIIFILLFAFASTASTFAQLVQKKLIVAPQFQNVLDTNHTVMIPDEYEINVFYAGTLKRPRFMALGPMNTIYVADMNANHIFALPDANHDGVADSAVNVAPEVDSAHSLAFYNGALYVAQPSRVRKFLDKNGDGFYETEESFITGIGDTGYYNHFTRTILFDTIGKHIYLSVGASCNDCREGDPERGTILRFNLDGSGKEIFATGLRNAIGLAMDPWYHGLWASNADRDGLGDAVPEEMITSVYEHDFFGWPFAYGNRQWENFQATEEYRGVLPLTSADTTNVNAMRVADIHIPAHSTPMAIAFNTDQRLDNTFAFVALHGSSPGGRTVGTGYKVIRINYYDSLDGYRYSDFLSGFLTDSFNYTYWGRPCGLVQDSSGDIFLSSDVGIPAIYRIHLRDQNAVRNSASKLTSLSIFPNPVSSSATITYTLLKYQSVKLELIDQLGRIIRLLRDESEDAGIKNISVSLNEFPAGIYYLRLQSDDDVLTQKVEILQK